ncbi:DUF6932 family protein [Paenibacillus thailandensis]|uniref:DUF6932 family protein n=1 Tax=Paenibacillus thailandensis TaxID=393250 RepID=A0ABW5R5C0_9BACL
MIQQFMPNGNLTPGIHTYTIHEFEQQFINEFTTSIRRSLIYTNFKHWLSQLLQVLPPRYVWLDGSFLTQKVDPNDIDLVVFYYPEDIQNQNQAAELKELINRVSRNYNCDAYFSLSFENWTPQQLAVFPQQNHKIMQTYWMGQFGFDRARQPKGMVQINQQELILSVTGGVKS